MEKLLSLLATVALSTAGLAAAASAPIRTYVETPGPAGALKGTMLAPASGQAPTMTSSLLPRKTGEAKRRHPGSRAAASERKMPGAGPGILANS